MALIPCPNCRRSISDKASLCPLCGTKIVNSTISREVTCSECGSLYRQEQGFCPICGCPNTISNPLKKKRKGIVIATVIFLIIFVIGLCGTLIINQGKSAIYYDQLESVTYKMLDGAVDAEKAGNLIKKVWYNAIYQERDQETDQYTMQNGAFVEDFNDALSRLLSNKEFQKTISAIENNQEEVLTLMKQLKQPPKKYEEAYSVLKTYYDHYLSLTNMVSSPTGSLQTFSDTFFEEDDATVKAYEKMKLYLN